MAEADLSDLQRSILRMFFELPESDGFVIAGGAGLVASGLSERPTDDVDLFGGDVTDGVVAAADALERACSERGWTIERMRDAKTFRRVVIRSSSGDLLVDLAVDSPPIRSITLTSVGPTYLPVELGARKLLALFDRAAARDFVDIRSLAEHVDLNDVLGLAAELDGGFDRGVLAEMLGSLDRFMDAELAELGADPTELRTFFVGWRVALARDGA